MFISRSLLLPLKLNTTQDVNSPCKRDSNDLLWQQHKSMCVSVCLPRSIPSSIDSENQQEETRIIDYRELISKPLVANLQGDSNKGNKSGRRKEILNMKTCGRDKNSLQQRRRKKFQYVGWAAQKITCLNEPINSLSVGMKLSQGTQTHTHTHGRAALHWPPPPWSTHEHVR